MADSGSLIMMNDPGQVKNPDGSVDQNAVFLFQHGINNAVVDERKKGQEQYWNGYLQNSLQSADWYNGADAEDTLEQRHS